MARADAIRAKLDSVLRRFDVTDRVVSIRRARHAGGDALTGRGVAVTNDDTVLDPQPAVVVAAKNFPLVIAGAALSADAEYLVTVSATAMSRADVTDPTLSFIFTDDSGKEEQLFISGFQPGYIGGVDILFDLILSSKKR